MSRRHRRPLRALARKARAGFTLVEVIVAMMIFTVGLLAMASTAGVVVKQMGDSNRMTVASAVARSRIEQLRLAPCTLGMTGSATTRGVTEAWRLTPMTRSSRIDVIVSYTTKNGTRTQAYRSMVPCV
jgi:type II secretion system protein I